ncbi:MAG: hypothetical protein ACMUHY_01955 [Thermoplasmatota archaeon]
MEERFRARYSIGFWIYSLFIAAILITGALPLLLFWPGGIGISAFIMVFCLLGLFVNFSNRDVYVIEGGKIRIESGLFGSGLSHTLDRPIIMKDLKLDRGETLKEIELERV